MQTAPRPAGELAWIEACRVAGGGAAMLRAALREHPEELGAFRRRVLSRVLVSHFRQRPEEVRVLLALDAGEAVGARRPDEGEEPPDEEGLTELALRPGMWPLEELFTLADGEFSEPGTWEQLTRAEVRAPLPYVATHVARRVKDRLRRGGKGPDGAGGPAPAPPGGQHEVAEWLELFAGADPELGGSLPEERGLYARVLGRLREHLAEAGRETAGPSYTLRKLFPGHAWPPEEPGGRGGLAAWLLGAVEARVAPLQADRAAALGACLARPAPAAVRPGLDQSAEHHLRADSYPDWQEVALWVGDAAPGVRADLGTFMRRVSRLDAEVRPFILAQVERLRRALEAA